MRGADHKQSPLVSYVNLEDRIPRDHPLRRVNVLADLVLRSMSAHFDALYAEGGRPSIAPFDQQQTHSLPAVRASCTSPTEIFRLTFHGAGRS